MTDFNQAFKYTAATILDVGKEVHTGHWQGLAVTDEMFSTVELLDFHFMTNIPSTVYEQQYEFEPNLPWAEDHFLERVGGLPLNPGVQYANWPYWRGQSDTMMKEEGVKFTHTYMERFWPKPQGQWVEGMQTGIRYPYGDLDDVVNLLHKHPLTRQAYLPVFFPEDTGAVHGGRIPCTLGYHFMQREGELHCWYDIRSCDFIRHFKDDVYMAARLTLWVLTALRERDAETWAHVVPGKLFFRAHSLHCFKSDLYYLRNTGLADV